MNTKNEKKGFLEIAGVQTVIASLICIILGLLVGYIVLLCINPSEAWSAMTAILKNFLYFPRPEVALEYFGSTLAKTAPLLMCTLSILFAYKVGLFISALPDSTQWERDLPFIWDWPIRCPGMSA